MNNAAQYLSLNEAGPKLAPEGNLSHLNGEAIWSERVISACKYSLSAFFHRDINPAQSTVSWTVDWKCSDPPESDKDESMLWCLIL